ncbi:MAG: hypothetical protein OXF60_03520 [Gammaproteobacteria bacterium]|nr:hypothetical protein [Gammaproteobacteria bacterium]MCY4218354.1 hypothetical protein [Gammaproteobacteria bacterium]
MSNATAQDNVLETFFAQSADLIVDNSLLTITGVILRVKSERDSQIILNGMGQFVPDSAGSFSFLFSK